MNEKNDNIFKPKATGPIIAAIVLVLVIALLIVVVSIIASSGSDDKTPSDGTVTTTTAGSNSPVITTDQSTTTGPDTGNNPEQSTTAGGNNNPQVPGVSSVSIDTNRVYEGTLLLIDSKNNYKISKDKLITRTEMAELTKGQLLDTYNFANVYGTTNGNYKVKSITGYYLDVDALDALNKMMADFAAEQGKTDVQLRNGYYYDESEEVCLNATGLVIDLEIVTENGKYPLKYTPLKATYYDWFIDNCAEYGFIHIGDRKNSAGEENYSSFRYVGVPHASYISNNDFDLESYLDYIKGYLFENRLVCTAADGDEWWIYYVPGSGSETTVKVIGDNYIISGNNYDGFVVAVNASELSR